MNRKFLPKKARLLTPNEFKFVFQNPKYIKTNFITLFARANKLGFPRIGLSISKKYIKYAHERNKIKRYARETFRINQHNLSATDFIITICSKKIINLKNYMLIKEFEKLWDRYLPS